MDTIISFSNLFIPIRHVVRVLNLKKLKSEVPYLAAISFNKSLNSININFECNSFICKKIAYITKDLNFSISFADIVKLFEFLNNLYVSENISSFDDIELTIIDDNMLLVKILSNKNEKIVLNVIKENKIINFDQIAEDVFYSKNADKRQVDRIRNLILGYPSKSHILYRPKYNGHGALYVKNGFLYDDMDCVYTVF